MSKYTEEELNRVLSDTGELLKGIPLSQDYDLEDILAEFGTGATKPKASSRAESPEPEASPPVAEEPEPVPAPPPAEPAPEPESPERISPAGDETAEAASDPEEPKERLVSLEDVMDRTVSAVMEEESAQRQMEMDQEEAAARKAKRAALRRARLAACRSFFRKLMAAKARPIPKEDEETLPPEPDMDEAEFEQKRLCRRHRGAALRCLLPAALLVGITAAEALVALPAFWTDTPALRFGTVGGLLLLEAAFALPLWREMAALFRERRFSCAAGALVLFLSCIADCVWCLVRGGEHLPLAGAAALVIFCFHLANLGGTPPWGVSKTEAGAVKQSGRIDGFYTHAMTPDPIEKGQNLLLPLLLATACVLAGVVCLSDVKPGQPFWVLTALLTAAMPLSLPVAGALPTRLLARRLSHSGCAVAGYCGAKNVSGFRRIIITDEDLFPSGTLSLHGLKIYGEELGRVLSYAVAVARAADSQALPLLEQMLSDNGGHAEKLDDFRWYEEGGAGGSIHGETVLLGSAYFMRKQKVRLPKDLKVPSGLFLAVDGQLTAIFALRYQPSRNVDWALRALRRNRVIPVLAVRGCNLTPDFLRRSFKVDAKPIYPDVQTRLTLLEKTRAVAPAHALIYRDGLMPYAETVLGCRKLLLAVRRTGALVCLAAVAGLLLCYYLTGIGGYASLTPLRLVLFQLLWLLPGLLLAGQVKYF